MALFNRKKDESVLPEVDQYYQAEQRDRTWLAWILAIISIAVVVLLLVGIFFAGKWAYNAVTGDDTSEVATNNVDDTELPSFDGVDTDDSSDESSSSENSSDDTESTDSPDGSDESSNDSDASVNAPAQTTTPSDGGPSDSSDTSTQAGKGNGNLTETGPAGLTSVFIVTSMVAAAGHYLHQRRRLNR